MYKCTYECEMYKLSVEMYNCTNVPCTKNGGETQNLENLGPKSKNFYSTLIVVFSFHSKEFNRHHGKPFGR